MQATVENHLRSIHIGCGRLDFLETMRSAYAQRCLGAAQTTAII